MGAQTAGQAAKVPEVFARWWRIVYPRAGDGVIAENWRTRPDGECEFWTGLAATQDDTLDDFHFERKQVVELRAVLTEIFTCLNTADMSLLDADQVDEWRERAGLPS